MAAASRPRPIRVALTGGIASGKSHCLEVWARCGAPVIDADVVARAVVAPGTPGLAAVTDLFGTSVLHTDGRLNREALAQRVFASAEDRAALEHIIHPAVYAAIAHWFETLDAPVGVADIPLLFETHREKDFDIVVVAACRPDQQLERLMARNGLSQAQAEQRLAAQWPLADKAARADYVIDTSGSLEESTARAAAVWSTIAAGRPSDTR